MGAHNQGANRTLFTNGAGGEKRPIFYKSMRNQKSTVPFGGQLGAV